jgi:phosphoenolpyruvate carboxylase
MRKIPATMASQHPDHASKPFWHTREFINTHDEITETHINFSELGIHEYKWDWEGKLVDESVLERMWGQHYEYFTKEQIGRDKFLTFRLPNPKVETEFRLGRAFMGILSAGGLAEQVGLHSPPLFEVILPMTETATEMIDVQQAFHELASLKHKLLRVDKGTLKHIELIPLFESVHTIMNSDKILEEYLEGHKWIFGFTPAYMRPYVARSDPALNAGIVPTVLAIKIALSHYAQFEKKFKIQLYPVIGSASLPFRGGLTPHSVKEFSNEYKGIRTTLIQSGFRYDYEKKDVIKAIKQLEEILPQQSPVEIPKDDEKKLRKIIKIFEKQYQNTVEEIAGIVNDVASQLPKRRERVQHVGLFGYSRGRSQRGGAARGRTLEPTRDE